MNMWHLPGTKVICVEAPPMSSAPNDGSALTPYSVSYKYWEAEPYEKRLTLQLRTFIIKHSIYHRVKYNEGAHQYALRNRMKYSDA